LKIEEFGVETWMNAYETRCALNLAETCVESLSIAELLALTGRNSDTLSELLPMQMTYGAIEGSDRLRDAICALYERQGHENVAVTHGTIGANALVYAALVSPGDRVVTILPTYQQHYSIPQSYGADVQIVRLREEDGFQPDLEALASAATPGTRMIAMVNPNNPTGALMPPDCLHRIIEIARAADAWILCDEVYRGTDQVGDGVTASIADLYEKGISTAGMSKAFSLAGLRLGWVVAPPEVIRDVLRHRDYNTISVGILDDHFATIALENADRILARSRSITRENLALLDEWVAGEPLVSYVKPTSGTTALLKYAIDMPSRDFCISLLEDTGVLFTPGSAFEIEGYVRIGFGNNRDDLSDGLKRVSAFLRSFQPQGAHP